MAEIDDLSFVRLPFGRATAGEAGPLIFTGAMTPHDPRTGTIPQSTGQVDPGVEELRSGYMFLDVPWDRTFAQAWQAYSNLSSILAEAGADTTRIVRQRVFVSDLRDVPAIERVMDHFLDRASVATTVVQISDMGVDPEIVLQLEVVAAKPGAGRPRPISDPVIDGALNGYPAAVEVGDFVFLSAVPGINPDTGLVPSSVTELGADAGLFDLSPYRSPRQHAILAQTWFTFSNMQRICQAVNADLGRILKVTGWLDFPMRDFDPTRPVRQHFFNTPEHKVASTGLWVGPTTTPDALLAYDAVCLTGESQKQVLLDPSLIVSYYVGATAGGGLVFTCGEVPIDEEIPTPITRASQLRDDRRLAGFGRLEALTGIEAQTSYVYDKLQKYLETYGSSLDKVVYQMVYLRDMRLHSPLEIVARSIFGARMPATTTVPILETSPFSSMVDLEIEVVAPL
ncbi:MAG: Rid family hydrolase [Acidimicrobiia bacterium]